MKILKKVNWFPLLPAFLTIGLAYFLTPVVNGSWEKVNHLTILLLFFPGLMFGFWLQQFLREIASPYNVLDAGGSTWQKIGLLVGLFAGFGLMAFLMACAYIIAPASSDSLEPEMLERFGLVQLIMWILTVLIFFWLIFCRGRYVVAKKDLTVIDGKIVYPGTKVLLHPWLNYKVDFYDSFIKMVAVDMKVQCKDGAFLVKIWTEAEIDISEAKARRIATIDYWNTVKEVRFWLLDRLMDEAKKHTILDYVLSQKSPPQFDAGGMPVRWDGKVCTEINRRA